MALGVFHSIKDGEKRCNKCGEVFSLDNFYRTETHKGCKLSPYCKECSKLQSKNYRTNYPEKVKLTQRKTNIKQAYGITLEEFNKLHAEQEGRCAICGIPETEITIGKDKRLFIDHNHKTKKVRGLLCHNCNMGLGFFGENILLFNQAIQYLKESD